MLKAENITKAYNHGNKVAFRIFLLKFPKGLFMDYLAPMERGKRLLFGLLIKLFNLIQERFLLMEIGLILTISGI